MHNKYTTNIFLAVVVAILIFVGGWFIFFGGNNDRTNQDMDLSQLRFSGEGIDNNAEINAVQKERARALEGLLAEKASGKTYVSETYNFSFRYPEQFNIGEFPEGENGTMVVAQDTDKGIGFQIFVSPAEEGLAVTPEQIRADIPDMSVEKPQNIVVGEGGRGLAFVSENDTFGQSREVWFIYKGNLYQISTYLELDRLLEGVMRSWKFF